MKPGTSERPRVSDGSIDKMTFSSDFNFDRKRLKASTIKSERNTVNKSNEPKTPEG